MRVTVHRTQRLRDWGPRYRVRVDGKTVGKVFSGRSINFDVTPGEHTMQCQVQIFSKSPIVAFTVEDEPLEFDCEPRLGTFASSFENMTDGDRHIYLRQRKPDGWTPAPTPPRPQASPYEPGPVARWAGKPVDAFERFSQRILNGRFRRLYIAMFVVIGFGAPLLIRAYDRFGYKTVECDYRMVISVPGEPTKLENHTSDVTTEIHPDWALSEPSLSPDGDSLIATRSFPNSAGGSIGSRELWLMGSTDGSNPRQLVGENDPSMADFSPDGSEVAFVQTSSDGSDRLATATLDGKVDTLMTPDLDGPILPQWSSDGSEIGFIDQRGIVIINRDGTNPRPVAGSKGAVDFSWEPKGDSVVATLDKERIVRINLDGSDPEQLANGGRTVWSPDGGCLFIGQSNHINAIPVVPSGLIFKDDDLEPAQEQLVFDLGELTLLKGGFDVGEAK